MSAVGVREGFGGKEVALVGLRGKLSANSVRMVRDRHWLLASLLPYLRLSRFLFGRRCRGLFLELAHFPQELELSRRKHNKSQEH